MAFHCYYTGKTDEITDDGLSISTAGELKGQDIISTIDIYSNNWTKIMDLCVAVNHLLNQPPDGH